VILWYNSEKLGVFMNLENLRKFEEIQVIQKYIAPLIIVLSGYLSLFTVINEIMITDSPFLSMLILFYIYSVSISIPIAYVGHKIAEKNHFTLNSIYDMDSVLAFVYKNWKEKNVKELTAILSKEFDKSKGIDITDEVVVAVDSLLQRKILDIVDEKTLLYLRDKTWVGKDKKYLNLLNKRLLMVSPEIVLTEKRESLLKELESVEEKLFNENKSLLMTTR
tara:strand:- start:76243 stop:76905 length:663 start_codon:yes stop_codon:yes gene_type:complete